ncbi:MAG TPA: ABC transporter substrate-binding protein, partial [Hyphomicrobiaceae bacterium]|nr:ABC transporter substrate-binding protein [Hyphomicrobiaceae bacterium]
MEFPRLLLAALTAMALCSAPTVNAQQPVKIRVSWVAPVSNWGSIWLEKKDLARHLGKSYVLEATRFAGTPPMVTAMASGELEVANFAYSTLGIAIKNAGMDDLRVIAHEFRDGAAGHYSQEYLALADGPVKSLADLKGKVIATNAAGSAVDIAMRAMLRKSGLEDKRDYTVVEAPFPTMKAMLAQKKADLATFVPPFAFDPELRQIGRLLFEQKEAVGTPQMTVWVVRKGFL